MFSVKFNLGDNFSAAKKTVNNFIKYMKGSFGETIKVVKDSESTEVCSGKVELTEGYNIELIVKKVIPINEDILNDRKKLDKVIFEIKDFCDNAQKIENFEYKELIRRIEYEDKIK